MKENDIIAIVLEKIRKEAIRNAKENSQTNEIRTIVTTVEKMIGYMDKTREAKVIIYACIGL